MIQKVKSYQVSDGRVFLTQSLAQTAELETLIGIDPDSDSPADNAARATIGKLMEKRDEVLAVLSTRKQRTPKVVKPRTSRAQPVAVKVQQAEGK